MDENYERKEAMVIVNPASRKLPRRGSLGQADTWLREAGWSVTWRETAGPGDALGIAAEAATSRLSLVFVFGGDGTLSEAANGLAGSETALGVIPAGTVNLWARELGVPKRPLEAVQLAAGGHRRRIDLGQAAGRYFMLMAGYGLDGAIAHGVSPTLKRRFGAAAYAVSAVRETMRYRGSPLTLRFDGEERNENVLMLVAGNTRKYAGITQVTPQAEADDGLLDICVYTGRGKKDILMHAARTLLKRHVGSRKVLYRRVRKLEMTWDRPLLVQLDGDAFAGAPGEITVAPSALWVATPIGLKNEAFGGPPPSS